MICIFLLIMGISLVFSTSHPQDESHSMSIASPLEQGEMIMEQDQKNKMSLRKKRYGLWQTTTRGTSCDGTCNRFGTDYYWCRTKRWSGETSWDYCSPWEGIDYYGNTCQQDCGFHGYSYKWCYITTGTGSSWGYCSTQSNLLF